MEIDIVTLVVKGSAKLTVPTDWQEQIQVGSRSVAVRCVFDLKIRGIHLTEIILKVWVYLYVKLNCDASRFLPARTVWIPLRMNKKLRRLGEWHTLCPWECQLLVSVGKPFPQTPRKCCQLETWASWWCPLFSVLALRIRVLLCKIGSLATYIQIFVSPISIFVKEVVPNNSC